MSKGNVAKSAIQAAVPAESNFIHKGNSSDACCFILCSRSFHSFFLSQQSSSFLYFFCCVLRTSWLSQCVLGWCMRRILYMGFGIVQSFEFSRLLEIPAWLVSILRACSFFFFFFFFFWRDPLLEKRYLHYIQSPTRGQEPLNDHLADGWFRGKAF